MKHVWKSKEKTDADVEEGLHENENIKREYVIQVVRETKYKWWSLIAIYMLVMFLFGLSYYMLRTYSFSETMSVICQKYLPMSESQFESQKSSPSKEALETSTESLIVDKLKLLENENDFPSFTELLAKSIVQSSSEMESDNTARKVFDPLLLSLLDDLKIQRLQKTSMSESQFESQKSSPNNEASTESLTVDKLKLLENKMIDENDFPPHMEALAKSIAQSSSEVESDNTMQKVFDPLLLSLLDDLNIQRLQKNSMSESQFESQKSSPSNEASTESLTVDKLKLLENKMIDENDFPPHTEALAKSIAQSSSEVESDNTMQKVFDPLLLLALDDSEIQRLKENSMEDLISVFKLFSQFENNSKDESLLLLNDKTADADAYSLTKNDNMIPEDLTSISKLFSEFENDSNKDELSPLLNVPKIADTDTHSSTKSDNMMPADDVKNLKTVPSSEDLKVDETHDENSSVESGVVNCPPDKFDEYSTEFSSSESAQLEEQNDTYSVPSDHQFNWLNVPSDWSFINVPMPYFWNSEKQASQLAYIRDSVKDIKQTTRNIKLLYGNGCSIIITEGVVDATLCPGFSEYDAESNLESSASPQTTTMLFSTQTNTILPSIQTSTMLPSTQTTTTTTEEDHDDYNYYFKSKDGFLPRNPFMPRRCF